MLKINWPRSAMAILVTSALAACGGGEGGENGNGNGNVPPPSISVTSTAVTIPEGGESVLSFSLEDAGDAAIVSGATDSDLLSIDIEGTDVTIMTDQVDNNTSVILSLKVKYGGQEGQTDVAVTIYNSSIESAFAESVALIDTLENDYQDETQLFNYASEVGYLSGVISASEKAAFEADFLEAKSQITDGINIAEIIESKSSEYVDRLITETDYRVSIASQIEKYNTSISAANAVANSLFTAVGLGFENLLLNGHSYNLSVDRMSQLLTTVTGNSEDGEWAFNSDYAFLETVLPSFNASQLCLIDESEE
jgi:hypothetical protein